MDPRDEDTRRRELLEAGARAAFGSGGDGGAGVLESLSGVLGDPRRVLLRGADPAEEPSRVISPAGGGAQRPSARGAHRVLGEIARGGMGVILRGRDEDLGREVAMKVLVEDLAEDPAALRRFVEEAQIGGQLQHPGIVPIYELGLMADRRPYFTMKLVRGRTLSELLARRASPAEERHRFISIFERVCQTVAYAHTRGVIHRDLKPSNVMVGAFGEVQVVDWGLAKVLARGGVADERVEREPRVRTGSSAAGDEGSRSRAGSVLGTPAYMAPEQAAGQVDALDERADVFSLGAILCAVLTGAPPYEPEAGDVLRQAEEAQLDRARARLTRSGADPELVELCLRCLAPRRADRPRTAEVVACDLAAYLAAVDERAREAHIAAAEARVKARAERRLLASGFAAVLLAAGTGMGLYLHLSGAARGRRERLESAVGAALSEAAQLRGRAESSARIADWREARQAGRNAVALLDTGEVGEELARRVHLAAGEIDGAGREAEAHAERERANASLLAALAEVRRPDGDGSYPTNWARVDAEFAGIFREAGLDLDRLDAGEAVARIRDRGLGRELASAIDEWAAARRAAGGDARALARIALEADGDDARRELRESLAEGDVESLRAWLEDGEVAGLPASTAVLLGHALGELGRRAEAVAVLRAARGAHPDDVRVNQFLARWLRVLDPPALEESAGYLRAAIALRPDSVELRHELAECLNRLEWYDQAGDCIRQALQRRPEDGHMIFHLGRALLLQRRFEEAVDACRESVRLAPDDAAARANLGYALNQTGDARAAVPELEEAIRLEPALAAAHHNLGVAFLDLGDPVRAEVACREAARLDPRDLSAQYNHGLALQLQERYEEAVPVFEAVLRLDPGHAKSHLELGRALWFLDDLERSREQLRETLRCDPTIAQAHFLLACSLRQSGDLERSSAAFREAARLEPRYQFNFALSLEALGDEEGAMEALRAAVARHPGHAEAHCELGRMLENAGRYPEAVEEFRQCHALGSRREDWSYPSESWVQHVEKGAELQRALEAFEHSGTPPGSVQAAMELAAFAFERRPGAAADLYRRGFELDPALAGSLDHLPWAAVAAARAAALPDAEPDDATRWRGQALAWLRAGLDALDGADATVRERVAQAFASWSDDLDLAGLRDPERALALGPGVREAWAALWPELEELLADEH